MKRRRSLLPVRLALYGVAIVAGVNVGGFFGGVQVGVCAMAAVAHTIMALTESES